MASRTANTLGKRYLASAVISGQENKEVKNIKWILCLLAVLCAGYARAADKMPSGIGERKTDAGMVLGDAKGMTLYTFDEDMKGMSMCTGTCAQNWPPLAAGADAKPMGDWTIVNRQDGTKQWAYKSKPLYTFINDTKPGDTAGNDVGGVWHVAIP